MLAGSASSTSRSPAKVLMSASSRKKPSLISRLPIRRTMVATSRSGYSGWYCTPHAIAPLQRISALCTSDTALVGEHRHARRQRLDLVEMHGRRVEDVVLAVVHRMLAAGFGELDAAAEADLAALRILAHHAAGGDGQHLQAPAASEHRRVGLEHRLGKLDLLHHRRAALIDVQRGAGDGDAVVAFERLAVRQVDAGIGREADVDHGARAAVPAAAPRSPRSPRRRRAATCSARASGVLPSRTSRRGAGIERSKSFIDQHIVRFVGKDKTGAGRLCAAQAQ